jgi:hypothetical protein
LGFSALRSDKDILENKMNVCLRAQVKVVCLLIFTLLMAAAPLSAQNLNATVYVSTAAGNQILAINGPTVSVLCSGGNKFVPEDIVVGPDGLIYVANTTQNQVWRIDPRAVGSSCVSGVGTEKIYDLKTTVGCSDISGAHPPVSSCPSGPEGPSFVSEPTANSTGSLDLVFNTHTSNSTQGVWTIPGIASLAIGCAATNSCPAPVRIIQRFSNAGEGIEFDNPGDIFMVDQAGNRVFEKTPPLFPVINPLVGAATAVITGLTSPVGVAVDTCNDVLVTSSLSIQRYNPANAAHPLDSVSFTGSDIPRFMEIDSSDRLYVVTAADESGTGGKVWLIALSPVSPPGLASCTLASKTPTLIANLAALKSAKSVANLSSGNALGLGLSATDFTSQIQCFTAGDTTAKLFNFGNNTVTAKCDNTEHAFCMQITTLKSRPTNSSNPEVTFNSPLQCQAQDGTPSFTVPSPVCVHYSSQHGFCTQYREQPTDMISGQPIPDSQFNTLYCPDPNFHVRAGFFSLDTLDFPGGAHTETDTLGQFTIATKPFDDCPTTDIWGTVGPGIDSGAGTLRNSKHVVFTSSFLTENGVITLKQPALSNNPQFNVGTQNISVKFNLNDAATGAPITNAIERLSIIRVSDLLPQAVVASNNSSFENFFTSNGSGQYSFNVDTSFFTLDRPHGSTATYQLTIWGNDAQPFTFSIVGTF